VLSFCYARVYDLFDDGFANASCGLDLLALVVDPPRYDGFGAVLILSDLVLREIEDLFVFFLCPVRSSVGYELATELPKPK
jgi:hypothetical protein